MKWEIYGGHEVFVGENGRIEARVFKHERGFGASLTPVNYESKEQVKKSFLGYFIAVDAAKVAVENAFSESRTT